MYRVANTTGRLVEIAIWSPVSLEETSNWGTDHDGVVDSVQGPYVCFVDLRGATVFPFKVVEAYVSTMRSETRLLRTATLLPESPSVALQISRMIRQAGMAQRQAFEDPFSLLRWFEEVLDDRERKRMRTLLRYRPDARTPEPTRR